MKNYIAGLAAKVIELSREAEKWRNKYQQLKKDYDNLEKEQLMEVIRILDQLLENLEQELQLRKTKYSPNV